jgi:hypothetical protein
MKLLYRRNLDIVSSLVPKILFNSSFDKLQEVANTIHSGRGLGQGTAFALGTLSFTNHHYKCYTVVGCGKLNLSKIDEGVRSLGKALQYET